MQNCLCWQSTPVTDILPQVFPYRKLHDTHWFTGVLCDSMHKIFAMSIPGFLNHKTCTFNWGSKTPSWAVNKVIHKWATRRTWVRLPECNLGWDGCAGGKKGRFPLHLHVECDACKSVLSASKIPLYVKGKVDPSSGLHPPRTWKGERKEREKAQEG